MATGYQSDDSTILPEAMATGEKAGKTVNVLNGGIAVDSEAVEVTFEQGVFYNGEVNVWKRTHGFLKHFGSNGVVTSFFVHASNVNSTDKRILLRKNMEVRFKVQRGEDGKKDSAVEVQTRDGLPLNFHAKHGEKDTYDRELQYDSKWFNGTIKFFSRKRGYGRITAVEEELKAVDAPVEDIGLVYFKEIDIDAAEFPVKIDRDDEVRFQLFNSSRGWGGMNIQQRDGQPLPMFTEEDRERKRTERDARRKEMNEQRALKRAERKAKGGKNTPDNENGNENEERPQRKKRRENRNERRRRQRREKRTRRRNRHRRQRSDESQDDNRVYADIDENQRFIGTVKQFAIHRYGFLSPDEPELLKEFGQIKNRKLCFRAQEIHTQQRPARVDNDMKVSFTIIRLGNRNTLYANDIRTVDGEEIFAEREFKAPRQKPLLSDEIFEGTVLFYNWRRGHGRILIDGEDESERYFFHRDDLRSNDKVPGIADKTRITCQKVDDPKGIAVTAIMTEDREMIQGFDRK